MTKKTFRSEQRIKPIGVEGIDKCRRIMAEGYDKVNEVMVDSFSASAIVGVYDRINDENKAKLAAMPVAKAADICFKTINRSRA